jgi:hypothetical protein
MKLLDKILFTFLALLNFENAYSQNSEKVNGKLLAKNQLVEDYSILYASLINYHPTPFLYTNENDLSNYYQTQISAFPDTLSEREFYVMAKKLITLIKCGHTDGTISDRWTKGIANTSSLLPFEVNRIGFKVFIKKKSEEETELEVNSEVLRINNVSVETILHQMDSIQSRDGITLSYVKEATASNFRMYYLYLYGYQKEFIIEFVSGAGEIKKTTVKSLTKKLNDTPKPLLPESFKKISSNDWSIFATDTINNLAYLRINSFINRKDFKDYYKEIFLYLQKYPSRELIIDIRNNTGGFFGNGNTLLSYLTPEKFDFNFQKPKHKTEKNKYAKLGKWNRLTKIAFSLKPSKHRVKGQRTFTFSYKPKKQVFTGKINVITNGITFSQAALVASHLKEYGATMYGTETGGTENSTNAMVNYNVLLPNSGFKTRIVHYQVISNSTKGEFGFGVKPDYELIQNKGIGEDNVLIETVNIIARKY